MSKQKVVSSLLLSTVVLGGLAFYPTTTVKAEVLEPDVTSVNVSDATNIPVVSNEEESDFLAEEELEDDDASEEELNEKAEEVTEPSLPEALLQPRAVMSNSETSGMEKIPVDDSVSEKVVEKPLIQSSNADSKLSSNDQTKLKTSVSVDSLSLEKKEVKWRVSFDTSAWSFNNSHGGFYFVLPEGLELTEIIDNNHDNSNIIGKFPTNVHSPENNGGKEYRFFSKEKDNDSFNAQWGWSAGQANPDDTVNKWKSENRFSKIYFIDQIKDTTKVTYTLTANVIDPNPKSFLLVAVMKSFGYKNHSNTEYTSLGAREITLEKEKTLPPKEDPKPEEPKQEAPQTPAPDAPQPEGSKDTPEASPKPEAPQTPPAPEASQPEAPESSGIVELGTIPKESLKVKVTFKEKGDILTTPDSTYRLQEGQYLEEVIIGSNLEDTLARAQKRVTTKEGYEFVGWALESDPEKEIEKNLKVSHDITLVAIVRKKSSEETLKPMEPKVEKPTPEVPQVPEAPQTPEAPTEEPKKEDAPAPEVPSTPEKQPEAPKEEPEQDAPQTPEAPSTPKEEAPKKEVPAPEVPSIPEEQPKETPVPEVPKQEEVQPEAPKSDKVETDKPMPETKKPDMKQPKADDMPKEQKPKAEEPKAEQPQMDKPQMEAPKEEPKQDAPKEEPQVPSIPEEQPKEVPAPPAPSVPEEKPMEAPKPEAPKDTPEVSPKSEAPTEEPKKEDEPGQELPKLMEPKVDKPTPEVPKQEDIQPEAPKTGKVETNKPMPEPKQPDMKQPKADDMPKEQQPKADEPKAEQPQMDKPQMEAPKKDSESPKSDKAETDKPMPETKKPDMKKPKADKPEAEKAQMPRTEGMKPESKASMMPKAEASKATLPNTGEASSAIGWLGGALATLVTGLYLFKNKKEE